MGQHAAQELKGTADLLQAVFDSAPNGIAVMRTIYDPAGRAEDFAVLLFNAYTRKWIGDVDYKGKRYSHLFPTVKETGILQEFIGVAETGVSANFERWYSGEGMKHWFRFTAVKQDGLLVVTTEDITAAKKAEEDIRQSEARFRFALKAGHLGFWELDLATLTLTASDGCKENFGQPIGVPFSYETLRNTIHPDDRQRQEEAVAATVATGKDYDIEYRVLWPDGTLHWVNIRGQLYAHEGKPLSMIGVSLDITERKGVEIALKRALDATQKQQRLYEAVANNTPDLVYVFDRAYRFTYANKALLSMWGRSWDDSIGKGLRDLGYEEWHAAMHEREIDEVVATKKSIRGTVSFPHAELGTRIYDYIFSPVFNEQGEVEAISGTTRDISEIKSAAETIRESEGRFRNLVRDAAAAIVVLTGPEMTVEIANEAYGRLIDRTPGELLGKALFSIVPETEAPYRPILEKVKTTGEAVILHDAPYTVKKDGKVISGFLHVVTQPYRNAKGAINGVMQIIQDVTASVQSRKALEESEHDLRDLVLQSPVGICVMDAATLVSEIVNDRFVEIAGKPYEAIKGHYYWDTFAEAAPYYEAALQGVVEGGEAFYANEVELMLIRHGREEVIYVTFVYEPMKDASGTVKKVVVWVLDNTVQVQARKKVEESEGRFRLLADASPNLVWMLHPDGSYAYVNKTTLGFLGVEQEQIAAVGWAEYLHPDDLEAATQAITTAVQNQAPYEHEHRLKHHNGTYRWVLSHALPAYDAEGAVFAYVGSSIDIDGAKTAQQALQESEERFRSMADASPVMIWTLDTKGNSTYYNRKAAEFTGHTEEELKGGKSWQVAIHPEDIAAAAGVVGEAVGARQAYQMECRMQRADGEWRWLLNQGTPRFGRAGEYYGFVGSSIDITEQKTSREALQTALEQMRLSKEAAALGTFDMDLEKGLLHWDDRCRTLFGISHHSRVTYEKDFVGGLHPDDRAHILAVIDDLFTNALSNGDYDVEYRTVGAEDGVVRWVRAKGKVYFNGDGKPVRFIGSVLDITDKAMAIQKIESLVEERTRELAQANETLQIMNKELQRSNANLEEFAHAASHDLKEPVRKIHFFTHQLKSQLNSHLQEAELRSFNRIENASQRMGALIDDLLLYSHVSQRPHETESIDLSQKVQRVLEDLELDVAERKAVIRTENLPVVKGYRRQLQQLFQNLISNALKYSKAGVPPHIDITGSRVTEGEVPYHLIKVKDNGIGFNTEYADKIFQMFTRLHGKNEYSGTGVGLSIVKKVVENHKGFIRVESAVGEGSVFKIYLPA